MLAVDMRVLSWVGVVGSVTLGVGVGVGAGSGTGVGVGNGSTAD